MWRDQTPVGKKHTARCPPTTTSRLPPARCQLAKLHTLGTQRPSLAAALAVDGHGCVARLAGVAVLAWDRDAFGFLHTLDWLPVIAHCSFVFRVVSSHALVRGTCDGQLSIV